LSNIKYVGLGLIIGAMAASLGIGALVIFLTHFTNLPAGLNPGFPTIIFTQPVAVSTQGPLPTSTFTLTPTAIALSTNTPGAAFPLMKTPDAVESAINNGGLIFTGILSNAQQIALYKSSLNYSQTTVQDSIREAKVINGVGYGDPSNICGPLAIAIMKDAGLLNYTEVVPHDFWLLDPRATGDQKILERVFPPNRFLHIKFSGPLNKTNWNTFPLQPGDFLFIWHGSGGNFDHMLVVTRVDSNLDAYTVTNFGTAQGFVISETMLYNPSNPNVGIFHTWTQEKDAILGSTGFGGFELWRPLSP
jgi:hypothetical protein